MYGYFWLSSWGGGGEDSVSGDCSLPSWLEHSLFKVRRTPICCKRVYFFSPVHLSPLDLPLQPKRHFLTHRHQPCQSIFWAIKELCFFTLPVKVCLFISPPKTPLTHSMDRRLATPSSTLSLLGPIVAFRCNLTLHWFLDRTPTARRKSLQAVNKSRWTWSCSHNTDDSNTFNSSNDTHPSAPTAGSIDSARPEHEVKDSALSVGGL